VYALTPQLSAVEGALKVTVEKHTPTLVFWLKEAGQVIVGAWLSATVTVKEQLDPSPAVSRALYMTVDTPVRKRDPLPSGVSSVVLWMAQLSA